MMQRYGYSVRPRHRRHCCLGHHHSRLIPPSLVLIVLANQLGRSVGDMYIGATGASILQVALFCRMGLDFSSTRPPQGRAGLAA